MRDHPLDPWIEGYLGYLTQVRRTLPRTVTDMRCTFKRVCAFMARLRPEVPLWELPLTDFLRWIESERQQLRSTASISKQISHLRGLLDYAWRSHRADRNVLDGFKLSDAGRLTPPRVLTMDEARRLVQACPRRNRRERRNRMAVLLFYGCGLRTSELQLLNVDDVDTERRELFIRHGKGDRQRRVPVPDGLWTELMAYLRERGGKRGALLRTTAHHARLGMQALSTLVSESAKLAGLTGPVTPKTLRHTFATHLMERGVDLAIIASLMGHRSPQESGVYLHVLPGRKESAVASIENNGNKEGLR